ncbi:hypothetical protein [Gimesia maris]|uniref:hypothetical protein n=1 Tax=Gimesia maris TaxID=122 RepID=UPI00241E0FCC|nr:hypothetical protein [Gimesia maris]|tara:strand:+ start:94786 stop:95085 length:300 start_codon:yes stop_codon:yes gene_type:complete
MDYPVPYQAVPTPGISSPLVGTADGLLFICPSEDKIQTMEPDPWFGEWVDVSDELELMGESEDFEPEVVIPGMIDRLYIGPIQNSLELNWPDIIRHDID